MMINQNANTKFIDTLDDFFSIGSTFLASLASSLSVFLSISLCLRLSISFSLSLSFSSLCLSLYLYLFSSLYVFLSLSVFASPPSLSVFVSSSSLSSSSLSLYCSLHHYYPSFTTSLSIPFLRFLFSPSFSLGCFSL